jgi:predicted regulator of Ras-like GTPase activity (Roadblock/LC7/MglB family)
MSLLRMGLELDGSSRGRQVRDIVHGLRSVAGARGALLVAPDGFVIAAEAPPSVALDPLAALAATLGRDLEVGAARLGRGAFQTAVFSADDGALFLSTTRIGFVVLLAEPQANIATIRAALEEAVTLIDSGWAPSATAT